MTTSTQKIGDAISLSNLTLLTGKDHLRRSTLLFVACSTNPLMQIDSTSCEGSINSKFKKHRPTSKKLMNKLCSKRRQTPSQIRCLTSTDSKLWMQSLLLTSQMTKKSWTTVMRKLKWKTLLSGVMTTLDFRGR